MPSRHTPPGRCIFEKKRPRTCSHRTPHGPKRPVARLSTQQTLLLRALQMSVQASPSKRADNGLTSCNSYFTPLVVHPAENSETLTCVALECADIIPMPEHPSLSPAYTTLARPPWGPNLPLTPAHASNLGNERTAYSSRKPPLSLGNRVHNLQRLFTGACKSTKNQHKAICLPFFPRCT